MSIFNSWFDEADESLDRYAEAAEALCPECSSAAIEPLNSELDILRCLLCGFEWQEPSLGAPLTVALRDDTL